MIDLATLSTEDLTKELCRRMAAGKEIPEDDYDQCGVPGELDTVGAAKDVCHAVLKAAKRNSLGGCLLCCS
jgi:hypothetical protein